MSLSTIYLGAVALVAIAILCTLVSRRTMFAYLQSWLEKPTPDYFALCDIAPPTPLPDFNIDKAKPRPYRPFRWDYHQTMGEASNPKVSSLSPSMLTFRSLKEVGT